MVMESWRLGRNRERFEERERKKKGGERERDEAHSGYWWCGYGEDRGRKKKERLAEDKIDRQRRKWKKERVEEITECNQVEEALTLLRKDISIFDIIITEQRLLGISEFELFRIGREKGLPVVVTSEDDGVDTIQRSLDYGACAYLEKPIPMRDLNMVWTQATPKKVLERMKTKGVRNVSRDQVSSHLQKHRLKLQKQARPLHMEGYKDKDGTSSGHVESRYEMEHPPMTLLNGFLNTSDPNQLDISSQQQRAPAAIKNTHGFQNLPLPVEANFCTFEGSTICANQNYTLMTQMAQAPFYWNESCPVGIFEHFTGEDIAHDHSEDLFFDDDTGSQPLDHLKPKSETDEVIPNSKENASLLNTLRRRRRQGMKIKAKKKEVVVLSLIKLLLFWY
uniref:Response regulatory domain-containing protein n=1 Tax=Quercus lobata TaxID=97700 RepID=A0A7N2LMY0_QUELO